MGKQKNTSKLDSPDLLDIPAYICFADRELRGIDYQWESWGLVIRHLRDSFRMDQTIFGRLLQGYTRGQIARYETEQTEPPIDFWIKLMRTFGLNINWALTGKGLPYIEAYGGSEERRKLARWERLQADNKDFLQELRGP
jgi:hypothetical protein